MGLIRFALSYVKAAVGYDCFSCPSDSVIYNAQRIALDREKVMAAARELGVDYERIQVFASDDFDEGDDRAQMAWSRANIRGVHFMRDGKHIILLNPRSATDNTVLHELRHAAQIDGVAGPLFRTRLSLEADAQRWGDSHEVEFAGILRR